ncbi:MAG TPA: hypothetical protein PK992_05935 [Planctomycetaceae bacterium]|nr:hypothetical protein [Planctomycetaceae bacterium]
MRSLLLMCWVLPFMLIGCGESSGRVAFSGNVTVSGTPLTGEIRCLPDAKGPMATTKIDNGAYQFTSETGPLPGEYTVIIESVPAAAKKGATAEPVVPLEWKLTRRIEAGSKNEADFMLDPGAAIISE